MRIIFFCFFCLTVFYSCKHSSVITKKNNSPISNAINLHEGNWYSNFKNEVFIRCLKKLYPQSFSPFIDSTDASSSANIDWLNYNSEVLKIADSLSNEFAKRKETSLSIENKKVTLNVCMTYRNSTELDSLAVILYNKFYSKD